MEVIRAILMMVLGVIFLSFIIRISGPLFLLLGIFIIFTVIRVAFLNNRYKNNSKRQQDQRRQQFDNQRRRQSNQSDQRRPLSDSDVIDAEYTEEELD